MCPEEKLIKPTELLIHLSSCHFSKQLFNNYPIIDRLNIKKEVLEEDVNIKYTKNVCEDWNITHDDYVSSEIDMIDKTDDIGKDVKNINFDNYPSDENTMPKEYLTDRYLEKISKIDAKSKKIRRRNLFIEKPSYIFETTSKVITALDEGYFKRVKFKDEEVKIEELVTKNTGAAPGPGNMIQ